MVEMRGIVVTLMSLVFAAEMAAAAGPAAPSFDLVTLGGEAYSKESLKGQPTAADLLGALVQGLPEGVAAALAVLAEREADPASHGLGRLFRSAGECGGLCQSTPGCVCVSNRL